MLWLLTIMHQHWAKPDPLVAAAGPRARDGLLALLDWDAQQIIWAVGMDSPTGLCFRGDELFVASMCGHEVRVFDKNLVNTRAYRHPLFNDLHTVRPTPDGVIVTTSGTDAIVELSPEGHLVWSWFATEHGFDRTPAGKRHVVDRRFDYSVLSQETNMQTTHVNSAERQGNEVRATLFAQGLLISIDRRTGSWELLTSGLDRPHSIRPAGSGQWTCCDSRANAVVLVNESGTIQQVIEHDFDWVQDAVRIGQSVYVLDANNMRVVQCDQRHIQNVVAYMSTAKGFGLELVPHDWRHIRDMTSAEVAHGFGRYQMNGSA